MSLANDVKMSRKNGHFLENIVLGHFGALLGFALPTTHSSKKRAWMLCKGKQLPNWLRWKPRYSHVVFFFFWPLYIVFFDNLIKNRNNNNEKMVFHKWPKDFHSNRCHGNLQCKCNHEMQWIWTCLEAMQVFTHIWLALTKLFVF